ncbi:MAG: 2-oxoacid:acceptor oxidoreductase family protein [Oscillospiraceae bacterium]|jgi:2-oxoglutarate ferredoxin oxidoreductase subunit gamma|nr:2-oxoacid:acceptor oxidoreductase family protein [Oscillospiraceae bacterium]
MTTNILLAGFGGQGILFAGKLLAYIGMQQDKQVSWLPSYGPEMRGGTCNCSVVLSDAPVGSPIVLKPDVLIAMNKPSFVKYEPAVVPGGKLFADSGLIDIRSERTDITEYALPASVMASDEGLPGLLNMILLGKVIAELDLADDATVLAALRKCIPPRKADLLEANRKAIALGKSS